MKEGILLLEPTILSLVIIDDEPFICELIRNLIDWKSLGIEIVGVAFDGVSGCRMICEKVPDIAITDIKMPGMNGLEIVRTVQDKGLPVSFLLISGHKDFEYAYTAINYGVENYLLKPINKENLEETIKNLIERIYANSERIDTMNNIKKLNEKATLLKKSQFLFAFINNKTFMEGRTLSSINAEYSLNFGNGNYFVLVIKPNVKGKLDRTQKDIILNQIGDYIQVHLSQNSNEMACCRTSHDVVCLLEVNDSMDFRSTLDRVFENIRMHFAQYCTISVGISSEAKEILYQSIEEAFIALQYRMVFGTDKKIDYTTISHDIEKYTLSDNYRDTFCSLIDSADTERINAFLDQISADFNNPVSAIKLVDELASIFSQRFVATHRPSYFDGFEINVADLVSKSYSIKELFEEFKACLKKVINNHKDDIIKRDSMYVQAAKQYIECHYSEKIQLDDIARTIYLSPVYFSVLFKKEEKMNFSEYLMRYRIDKAKELLCDPSLSISEIGRKVGYGQQRYFSQIFKRIVGLKPSEYRKIIS